MFLKTNKIIGHPDFEGTEAKLYIKGDYLYKMYIGNKSSIYHLMNLINKQKEIKYTVLPDNILYMEDDMTKLIGCRIKYFKEFITLSDINCPLDERLDLLLKIFLPLKELLENNIYPKDLDNDNILIGDTVQLIDLDSFNTKITKDYDKESYIFVLKLFKVVLLTTIYTDFEPIKCLPRLEEYLESKKINKSLIHDMTKDEFDFGDAKSLVYYLKEKNNK